MYSEWSQIRVRTNGEKSNLKILKPLNRLKSFGGIRGWGTNKRSKRVTNKRVKIKNENESRVESSTSTGALSSYGRSGAQP